MMLSGRAGSGLPVGPPSGLVLQQERGLGARPVLGPHRGRCRGLGRKEDLDGTERHCLRQRWERDGTGRRCLATGQYYSTAPAPAPAPAPAAAVSPGPSRGRTGPCSCSSSRPRRARCRWSRRPGRRRALVQRPGYRLVDPDLEVLGRNVGRREGRGGGVRPRGAPPGSRRSRSTRSAATSDIAVS
eukprot:SAG22_NODE_1216_length_5142_cov_2.131866_1_plen_186_part_00